MNESKVKKTITLSPRWAIGIVITSMLSGLVAGAFGAYNALNTDHFTIINLVKQVDGLENNTVNKELYELEIKGINSQLSAIRGDVTEIKTDIKEHIRQTNNILNK